MPMAEDQISELKRAYRILDAPLSSSASSIKQSYRKLVRRWHPDRYQAGTPQYAEATHMTKLINGAYSKIENAPLRYHVDAFSSAYVGARETSRRSQTEAPKSGSMLFPKTDWVEFWVRFVCGALLGTLLSVRVILFHYDQPALFVPVSICLVLGFGIAAAQSGDNFWHSVLRRWWMWR
jgi:curved DNA-binding protein CbpA